MCGIVGVFSLGGSPVQDFQIKEMLSTIAYRGPDGARTWVGNNLIGLGHGLLHTTPESFYENQPLNKNGCCITADARVDNREELLPLLGIDSSRSAEIPDSEILLAAYQKWGPDFPVRIVGDFSFAIWDDQKHELLCGRDVFGVKPFYYQRTKSWFIFGSEIKTILAFPYSTNQINEFWLANFYIHNDALQDKAQTFYTDIFRLPPAHTLRITSSGQTLTRYWSFDPHRSVFLNSDDEYADALRHHFQLAVKRRMRSAFPMGSTVSGGLDSSSIACMLRELNPDQRSQIHTFSAVYQQAPDADESSYINAVVQQQGFHPHLLYPDRAGPFVDLSQVLRHMDEPFYGTNYFMPWLAYRCASENGVRIFMDGTDGDTTISHGMDHLELLAQAGQWEVFAQETKLMAKRFDNPRFAGTRELLFVHGTPQLTKWIKKGKLARFVHGVRRINHEYKISTRNLVVNWGVKPLLPVSVLRFWKKMRGRPIYTSQPPAALAPELIRKLADQKIRNRAKTNQGEVPNQNGRLLHFISLNNGMLPYSLEWLNRMASAFSIDLRFPYCDRDLAEFCLALPASQKLRNGWTRFVFRNAMKNILPEDVRWRGGKASFYKVFPYMLKRYDQDFVLDILRDPPSLIHNYVNMTEIRKMYREFIEKDQYANIDLVWQTVVIAIWLRQGNFSTG